MTPKITQQAWDAQQLRIRALVNLTGLSTVKLAAKAGWSQSYLWAVLNKPSPADISDPFIARLAKALGATVDYIRNGNK